MCQGGFSFLSGCLGVLTGFLAVVHCLNVKVSMILDTGTGPSLWFVQLFNSLNPVKPDILNIFRLFLNGTVFDKI